MRCKRCGKEVSSLVSGPDTPDGMGMVCEACYGSFPLSRGKAPYVRLRPAKWPEEDVARIMGKPIEEIHHRRKYTNDDI